MLNFCDFIQVFIFTTNQHLKERLGLHKRFSSSGTMTIFRFGIKALFAKTRIVIFSQNMYLTIKFSKL